MWKTLKELNDINAEYIEYHPEIIIAKIFYKN